MQSKSLGINKVEAAHSPGAAPSSSSSLPPILRGFLRLANLELIVKSTKEGEEKRNFVNAEAIW
jgi:hypothetical protein